MKTICGELSVDDPQEVTEFIEDAFSYRLPWGVSSYVRLASALTSTQVESRVAANLAGMVKYGVPSPEAAWAMSAGVASRHAAMAVANYYHRTAERWLGRYFQEVARPTRTRSCR